MILIKVYQDEDKKMQMENWSLLSDNVRYVQHDEKSKTPHKRDINTLDYHQYKELYHKLKGEKNHTLDVGVYKYVQQEFRPKQNILRTDKNG